MNKNKYIITENTITFFTKYDQYILDSSRTNFKEIRQALLDNKPEYMIIELIDTDIRNKIKNILLNELH